MVSGWTPDGKGIVFSSPRTTAFPANTECFVVPVEGKAEKNLPLFESKERTSAQSGDKVAFVRGPGTWYSAAIAGRATTTSGLARRKGRTPNASPPSTVKTACRCSARTDGSFFYVTENAARLDARTSSARTFLRMVRQSACIKRITTHDDDTVRRAAYRANGEWIVYECGADLWVVSA